MAFQRADTARSMLSRQWSTTEMYDGLSHILGDSAAELPDSIEGLEALEKHIADIEARQSQEQSLTELQNIKQQATPQNGAGPPVLAVESQELMDTIPGSPECLKRKGGDDATMTTPKRNPHGKSFVGSTSPSSPVSTTTHVPDDIIGMVKRGILTFDQAMVLLKEAEREAPPDGNGEDDRKRGRQVLTPSKESDMASPAPKEPKGDMDKATKVALKARLRRLCEDKSKGNGAPRLQVPEWLHEEWKKRDHLEMALEFKDCNFNKDEFIKRREKTVTEEEAKRNKVEVGWYSKEDMSKVLKWNTKKIAGAIKTCEQDPLQLVRKCKYGGEDEYWVEIRETGSVEQNMISKDERKEYSQDKDQAPLKDVCLDRLKEDKKRMAASQSGAVATTCEALRGKEVFTKHCDSVLQKTAKLRSLVTDLTKHYEKDETVKKSMKALEADITKLDSLYNDLGEVMAEGERDDFNDTWRKKSEKVMKDATFVCAKAVQNEAKIRNAKRHFKKLEKETIDD